MLRTAVIGVGHLGRQHARIHAILASEEAIAFISACDLNEQSARSVATERGVASTTDWRELIGRVDAVSLAVPTEAHSEIATPLLENGIHVLVEKPIARTLEEADLMIAAAKKGKAVLQIGHLERFNPALVALKPYVKNPVYFEIHRVGAFTARSLDIDVVLDLMIHDLDIVQSLVGDSVEVAELHAVGIPILTNKVDAANARLEFASGAVANITASRVGTERIRKMRFFQPHDYIAVDYTSRKASVSNLAPPTADGAWPGVRVHNLEVNDVEPLRAEIESFIHSIQSSSEAAVSGRAGKTALALALRVQQSIHAHATRTQVEAVRARLLRQPEMNRDLGTDRSKR